MRAVICAVLSFFLPGLGDGITGRYRSMALWVAAAAGVVVLSALSIWLVPMTIAIRVSAMIGGFRGVRAADRAGIRTHWLGVGLTVGAHAVLSVVLKGLVIEAFAIPSSSMAPTLAIGDHIFAEKLTLPTRGVARGDVVVFRHPCPPAHDAVDRVIALAGETIEVRCNVVHVNGAPLASTLIQGEGCSYVDRYENDGAWQARSCSEYAEVAGAHTYAVYHDAERPARDASPSHGGADVHDFPVTGSEPRLPSCESQPGGEASARSNQAPGSIVDTHPGVAPCDRQRHYVVPAGHVFVLGDNRANSNDSRFWGAVPIENLRSRANGIWWSNGSSGMSLARFGSIR